MTNSLGSLHGLLTSFSSVVVLGPEISRISPKAYLWIFVPFDVISLVLQGTGGGLSSVLSQEGKDPQIGSNVMIAGLAFQVFTLTLFMVLCLEYGLRYLRARRQSAAHMCHAPVTADPKFQIFLAALVLATLCIFIRCVYRVFELSQGWDGELLHDEPKFIVLEGM